MARPADGAAQEGVDLAGQSGVATPAEGRTGGARPRTDAADGRIGDA